MVEKQGPFEHFTQPVISTRAFLSRLARHGGLALSMLLVSLLGGMAGYHAFAGLSWIDAFLDASMILTGMGPVSPMTSNAAKLFSGFYALYSGIAFLTAMGIFFAPLLHRMLHKFHLDK